MSFAELYKDHAYADLIKEAETQGMGRGVIAERERIIKLLEDECEGDWPKVIEMSLDSLKALIKGGQK